MALGEQFSDVLSAARTGAPWALERLYQADLALKTSRVEPDLALSRLVQALAEAR